MQYCVDEVWEWIDRITIPGDIFYEVPLAGTAILDIYSLTQGEGKTLLRSITF